jgi:integrase
MRLTDLTVKNLVVEGGQRTFFDDSLKGFGVRVSPKSKTFVLVIHRRNCNKWETLGRYPLVSLAKAREEAKNRLSAIQLGLRFEEPTVIFSDAYETFLASYKAKNRKKTVYEMERIVKRHLMPKLRHELLTDITTDQCTKIIDKLIGTPAECAATYTAARTLFRWMARRRMMPRSPLENVPIPVNKAARSRALTDDELVAVWRACHSLDNLNPEFAAIVKLLLLTGQRKGQVALLAGEWVDRVAQRIAWPAEVMKGKRVHTIPLPPVAFAIVKPRPEKGFVFLGRDKEKPFNGFSKCKAELDERANIAPWTLHDLRRTFSTGIAKLGVLPHIKEMLLAHSTAKDPVEAIYDLHQYEAEMRDALNRWECHVRALLDKTGQADAPARNIRAA